MTCPRTTFAMSMGTVPENYHKLKHYPDIQAWFEEALIILEGLIEPTIETIKQRQKLTSHLTANLSSPSHPWPIITCRAHEPWDRHTASPLGKTDFTLITHLARTISNLNISNGYLHPHDFKPGLVARKTARHPIYLSSFRVAPHMKSFAHK